jgi:PKD repeat protein
VFLPSEGPADREYAAVFGADLGDHDPNTPTEERDFTVPAAGPYAVNIHGEKGFDAGDVCILEWLTWRTDGLHRTIGYQWQLDNGFVAHPFAGPLTPRGKCVGGSLNGRPCAAYTSAAQCGVGGTCVPDPKGFADYNLDGMVDQGEARPELSENYSVDSDAFSANNGTDSVYPFNRQRMMEDIIEALDNQVDWDDFIDANSLAAVACPFDPSLFATFPVDPKGVFEVDDADIPDVVKPIQTQGLVSGIIIVPANAYQNVNLFPTAPSYYPIHNEDNNDQAYMFPDYVVRPFVPGQVSRSWNLQFHDLVICANCRAPAPAVTPYAAHEYLHTWQKFPDLYDYDVFDLTGNALINCPIGAWDIMANGGLVHPVPALKDQSCTDWIDPIDLRNVVTPGVETTITLPPSEIVRDSYYYLENEERPGERYWLYSAGARGFGTNLPGDGMIILHTDLGANPEGSPPQQRTAPFSYEVIQADGLDELQGGIPVDPQCGDAGDPWPGTTGTTRFNFDTVPPSVWTTRARWTGMDVSNVQPDGTGSVRVTLTLTPTSIPSLSFINPPGGETVAGIYQIRTRATDVFGGTVIRMYSLPDARKCSVTGDPCVRHSDCAPNIRTQAGNPVRNLCQYDLSTAVAIGAPIQKSTPGTNSVSVNWTPAGLNGRFVTISKLFPSVGADGTERAFTTPRAGRNNIGNGQMTNVAVVLNNSATLTGETRLETWTAKYVNATTREWIINSNITQPALNTNDPSSDPYPKARTGVTYPPSNYSLPVTFRIDAGSTPFQVGDTFNFTTTGVTAASQPVTVTDGRITLDPVASIIASPLSGDPPLTVTFDGRASRDPNGEPLQYRWDFGDGSVPGTGAQIDHPFGSAGRFTVVLRVTNVNNGRFGEAAVDIEVTNNSPNASISANPTSGRAPLEVQFSGNQSSDRETGSDQLVYQWDFGDGSSANAAAVAGLAFQSIPHTYQVQTSGTATSTSGALLNCSVSTPCCTQERPCQFAVTLTVTDGGGRSDTETTTIRVGNTNPTPVIRAVTSLQGPAPFTVRFNARSSFDLDGDPMEVEWIWGDGSNNETYPVTGPPGSTTGDVPHQYSLRSGETTSVYEMNAIVRDNRGGQASFGPISISVTSINLPPTVSFFPEPLEGIAGSTVFAFDASGSRDPDGEDANLQFRWNFGDGSPVGTAARVTHIYAEPNEAGYTVTLTVTDERGAATSETRTVRVVPPDVNLAPVARIATGLRRGAAPVVLSFDGRASYDVNGDSLSYTWRFRVKQDGSLLAAVTGPLVNQLFSTAGTFTVELSVSDGVNSSLAGPEDIVISVPAAPPDPPPGQEVPDDSAPPDDSADQRPPTLCGLGMIGAMFGTLVGLSLMRLARRRRL